MGVNAYNAYTIHYRTMEVIESLEGARSRGPYSGCCGFISLCGDADLNIIIRTSVDMWTLRHWNGQLYNNGCVTDICCRARFCVRTRSNNKAKFIVHGIILNLLNGAQVPTLTRLRRFSTLIYPVDTLPPKERALIFL